MEVAGGDLIRGDQGDFSDPGDSLITLEGKILHLKEIKSDQTDIDRQSLAAGNYLLQMRRDSGEVDKSFNII